LPPSKSTATSSDGTRLAVYTYGDSGAPVLVCVHGYPDNATLWEPVAELLADDFQVVTYDVRGAGHSDHPSSTKAYTLDRLQEDFRAVIDQVSPDQPVHVLAHDWGSIQSWHFVTDPAPTAGVSLQDRIASFVSISGPSLDHAGYFIRRRNRATVKQLLHSWYIFYFHLPWLPERGWRKGWAHRAFRRGQPCACRFRVVQAGSGALGSGACRRTTARMSSPNRAIFAGPRPGIRASASLDVGRC